MLITANHAFDVILQMKKHVASWLKLNLVLILAITHVSTFIIVHFAIENNYQKTEITLTRVTRFTIN